MLSTIIIFIIILSVLVFFHELGHFVTARLFGVKAEEFGFGFPPRAIGIQHVAGEKIVVDKNVPYRHWRWVWGSNDPAPATDERESMAGTIYSLNWLPLGGFVKIKGEQGDQRADTDSFASRSIWQRAIILSAGVFLNLVLAAVFLSIGYMVGLPQAVSDAPARARVSDKRVQIVQVLPDTPASSAGLVMGDIIVSINDVTFSSSQAVQDYVAERVGQPLYYVIRRGANEYSFTVTPETMEETGRGGIGVAIDETGLVSYSFVRAIWEGVAATISLTWCILVAFAVLLKNIIIGQGVGADVSGPVGIAVVTGQVAQLGFVYVLQFAAMLSINLAIINYLPFPALDGGRVFFLLIEKIRGRALPEKIEAFIHTTGFALLMLLVLVVTFRDVLKFSDTFANFFERIF